MIIALSLAAGVFAGCVFYIAAAAGLAEFQLAVVPRRGWGRRMTAGTYKPQLSYRVRVTEGDIESARIGDSYNCVGARAIARHIPAAQSIRIDDRDVRFTIGAVRLTYATPWPLQRYLRAFDEGVILEPFTFGLRDPIVTQAKRRTPAGTAIDTARKKVTRAKTPAARAKAEAALAKAEADTAGKPRTTGQRDWTNRPGPGRPPRQRVYGGRTDRG